MASLLCVMVFRSVCRDFKAALIRSACRLMERISRSMPRVSSGFQRLSEPVLPRLPSFRLSAFCSKGFTWKPWAHAVGGVSLVVSVVPMRT